MTLVPGTHRRGSGWLSTSPLEPKLSPGEGCLLPHACPSPARGHVTHPTWLSTHLVSSAGKGQPPYVAAQSGK